jgi:hypothetical protein
MGSGRGSATLFTRKVGDEYLAGGLFNAAPDPRSTNVVYVEIEQNKSPPIIIIL